MPKQKLTKSGKPRKKRKSTKMKQPNSKVIKAIIRLGGTDALKQYLKTGKRAKKLDNTNPQHRAILAFFARNNYIIEPFDRYIPTLKESFGLLIDNGALNEIFTVVKKRKDLDSPIELVDVLREATKEFLVKALPDVPRKKIKMYRVSAARMLVRFKSEGGMQHKIIRPVRGFLQMEDYKEPEQSEQQ